MKSRLLVTIFTRNRPDFLAANLTALRVQTFQDWDLLIVDDFSDFPVQKLDFVKKFCERLGKEGHVVDIKRLGENVGIANARKLVFDQIKEYPFAMDLNDDHIMEAHCLERLFSIFKGNPTVGAVGSATPFFWEPEKWTLTYPDDLPHHCHAKTGNPQPIPPTLNFIRRGHRDGHKFIELKRYVDYIYLKSDGSPLSKPIRLPHVSQFMYRTAALKRSDLPNFFSVIGFTEETDFCLRIARAGYDLYFKPDAVNWHMQASLEGIRAFDKHQRVKWAQQDFLHFLDEWWDFLGDYWTNDPSSSEGAQNGGAG